MQEGQLHHAPRVLRRAGGGDGEAERGVRGRRGGGGGHGHVAVRAELPVRRVGWAGDGGHAAKHDDAAGGGGGWRAAQGGSDARSGGGGRRWGPVRRRRGAARRAVAVGWRGVAVHGPHWRPGQRWRGDSAAAAVRGSLRAELRRAAAAVRRGAAELAVRERQALVVECQRADERHGGGEGGGERAVRVQQPAAREARGAHRHVRDGSAAEGRADRRRDIHRRDAPSVPVRADQARRRHRLTGRRVRQVRRCSPIRRREPSQCQPRRRNERAHGGRRQRALRRLVGGAPPCRPEGRRRRRERGN